MIEILFKSNPAFLFFAGAIILPFLKGHLKNLVAIAIPAISFFLIHSLTPGTIETLQFLHYDLSILRVDKLSKAFGYIFTLSSFAAFIYGYYQKKSLEFVSTLVYVGSALGVVFSGDLFSLYMFWELMAVFSTFLILANKTHKSMAAAKRYILVHIAGGLILLAGIILHINGTGSIEFTRFASQNLSTWLILIGFLINAGAIPFSSWLPDAYPEATVLGGVVLSAYTSKTAVYTLARGFAGWDILIMLGCGMAIYGIIYALLENDMRRILAYSIINQVGFMVCAVGIGTPLAISGAVAHAFCHIIYKALLWMSAGSVLYRVGKSKCTEIGGLYRTMPLTLLFGLIGALAISSVPLTSGFTSKTIIILAAEYQHLVIPWLILEIASAGVFLHAGIKFPYFVFFNVDRGLRPKEAPFCMLLAMGFLAFLCIYLGCFPESLYNILPDAELVKSKMAYTFSDIYIHHFPKVITQMQMLMFSGLVFFLFLPMLKRTDTISIDFDWGYRKGATYFYKFMDLVLNSLNKLADTVIIRHFIPAFYNMIIAIPVFVLISLARLTWVIRQSSPDTINKETLSIHSQLKAASFPIGLSAILTLILFVILFIL
ncbi:Na(+)/H(+) antiporter subunit D [Candidatus Marinamargulisbacteria bacterium SCGC AG-333-B06]|nr:Na(+)/H(+) antiporter subunit D [Candidatus Marinamargulisbacteria bacterium SCGC AG-333-B06]